MDDQRILDMVKSPADLKLLSNEELSILAQEIREEIVTVTSRNGGHVASSLGAVEIILAVHSVLNCPHDRFVFDVGHQAYAHKLVTGRLGQFATLRRYGGMSGFPKPSESPYDSHPSGHASDSLSVALGYARARDLRGDNQKVVALIGDAALAGGMAFEALNQIGFIRTPMVIILNDNEMAISRNTGALMRHLGRMRASSQYRQVRDNLQERMEHSNEATVALLNFGRNMKESMKQFVLPRTMIYEQMGILCTAPIDGHDIAQMKETLQMVLETDGPVLMHVVTKKGAGYSPAANDPETFHGVGPYNVATGEIKKKPASAPTYTSVFGDALVREAHTDASIVAMTAAMKGGTGLAKFAEEFPSRFIDTGITEEHAVGMASGLAFGGMKPVVTLYSTFLQRAVDQLIVNNALANANVVFAIDRAGLVGDDGPTHHGVFDLVYTRMVPNMRVLTPSDEAELASALHTALTLNGPVAIRYPRGEAEGVPVPELPCVFEEGVSRVVYEPSVAVESVLDATILAFGRMVGRSVGAAKLLAGQGLQVRVVDMRWAKPLDAVAIAEAATSSRLVVTVEEGALAGGVGEGVLAELAKLESRVPAITLGIPDQFIPQGSVDVLLSSIGLDADGIASTVAERLR
ncbi:1-deoxy-D-xylulose-5-phosphate synthase [Adlercreutzia sp. ZJ138]|uniref:1-deoxy-D-xylulose-5-phosphate synthase n=1 Tax=Adlercreutzia sp. ZJ138 TaxID=2709405 RepID=UPI0013EC7B72|nr:1-deoxy-D-xylulose-5-phosphate synthase [Adlercreutzia sp. ZJ138]